MKPTLKERVNHVIFYTDTPASRGFDLVLIAAILLSVVVVMLDSVQRYRLAYGAALNAVEWGLTILFTIEYAARIWATPRRLAYIFSFFGIVDLLAILPSYLAVLMPGTQYLVVVRTLRLLRVFRVLRLASFVSESSVLMRALLASRHKIYIFLFAVSNIVVLLGAVMYVVEGPPSGFTSIPRSIYWAIVTITTVGYGDIAPQTPVGQFIAAVAMFIGFSIIAVPTGIVSAEIQSHKRRDDTADAAVCHNCQNRLIPAAEYCHHCGVPVVDDSTQTEP